MIELSSIPDTEVQNNAASEKLRSDYVKAKKQQTVIENENLQL